jgi:hypothetical protein
MRQACAAAGGGQRRSAPQWLQLLLWLSQHISRAMIVKIAMRIMKLAWG